MTDAPRPKSDATCPVCAAAAPAGDERVGEWALNACPRCGLRFCAQAWGVPVDYDAVYRGAEYRREYVRAIEERPDPARWMHFPTYWPFFREVPQQRGAALLDVGCGVGKFALAAHARGWKVTGIDVSEDALTVARRHAGVTLRKALLADLVREGARFQALTAFEVVEHVERPISFLREARDLLSDGGHLFCTVPNWDCEEVRRATRPDWLPPVHVNFFSRSALLAAGAAAGFSSVNVGYIDTDPPLPGTLRRAKWALKRVLRRPRPQLGLWLHATR